MQAVILAAGKGTRLVPFTLTRSKAMAPIVGKPMVERVYDSIVNAGISEVTIVISPHDTHIESHFKNLSNGKKINFVVQKERLGMAHALICACEYITEDFVLSACDSLISADFVKKLVDKFKTTDAKAVLALMNVSDDRVSKTGIVEFTKDKKIAKVIEKPSLEEAPSRTSSLPLYVFSKEIIAYLDKVQLSKRGEYELQDAIDMLITEHGPLDGEYTDFRYDLTNPEDLRDLNIRLLKSENPNIIKSKIDSSVKTIQPIFIGENVLIGNNSVIGPNIYIESESIVGENAKITNSVLLKGSKVEDNALVTDQILL